MKKGLFIFPILTAALISQGCVSIDLGDGSGGGIGGGGSSGGSTSQAANEAAWTYSAASPVYELAPDVATLNISGVPSGKYVYMAKTNPTSTAISAAYTQSVASASGIALGNMESSSGGSGGSGSGSLLSILIGVLGAILGGTTYTNATGFVPQMKFNSFVPLTATSLSIGTDVKTTMIDRSSKQISLVANKTTKAIYVDNDANISTFARKDATLRAVGKYCNVWVIDDYYTNGKASGSKVNAAICSSFADKFDGIYGKVRELFGEESDEIYYYYSNGEFKPESMSRLSDTGMYDKTHNKVNIVIYDIGGDAGSANGGGVVGYFYAKDYFPNGTDIQKLTGKGYSQAEQILSYSNEGKYFYVDSKYAVNDTTMVYSTLAHEFQHMVHWNQKTMKQDLESGSGFNEMLSMLCEDLLQSYLGLDDDDSPKARLPLFEKCYPDVGLEYRDSSSYLTLLSYADNYAFGAWLARNFGGAQLVKALSTNAYVDAKSIEAATGKSMEYLLKWYAVSCLDRNSARLSPSYTFNRAAGELSAINLWTLSSSLDSTYAETKSSGYYKFDGPATFGYNAKYNLRPYGMTLNYVGKTTDQNVSLNLGTSTVSSNEKVYIVISDTAPATK
ncbi:MAG: hypothetical protein K6G18_03845 [Treponema sp.]|nr:hypothetical protein [Treponema sp.]